MTFFQFKPFSFINLAIKRIVEHIKVNAKKQCFFVNLKNATFWMKTPKGEEIHKFFKEMKTDSQIINFIGLFDIFVVGFHNGINAFISMSADSSSRNFEKTLWVSISKGYNLFSHHFSGRATPSIEDDLRNSIGSTPVQLDGFSTSPYGIQDSYVESDFQEGLSTFGQYSQFQGFGGPTSVFSQFSEKPRLFQGTFQPIAQGGYNPFISQDDFIPVQLTNEPIRNERKLKIVKGRVVNVEIPSDCSSGPSTSSTVGKKSPKAPTPVSTTIANLEKKIAHLEKENPTEGSLNHSELRFTKAKLEKIRNSL